MSDPIARAGLSALIILQAVMLTALYAGVPPHPPAATPLFAMAPWLGAALALAAAALILGPTSSGLGRSVAGLAALMALVSYGPHKLLDAQIAGIWPSVCLGMAAAGAVVACALRGSAHRSTAR
ncbi:hypothetical protein JANAI62_33430 [Jannaschia pagri]|uniref:Uncharacterized protein n=1 Tax=Jannaschia pagri TaxID=2829797 RepID=A0ABQ4NR08_9RHOB|nr:MULTISPECIES: hypothetical protein [unclassified Jannaschia]GIT92885.1 hypothetical protein JANAI61_33430 [Jannaschia sp. AI_61]GIT96720.1 hypothetical protein JANAI62_33430 [Jannaschia sp. AI_62]